MREWKYETVDIQDFTALPEVLEKFAQAVKARFKQCQVNPGPALPTGEASDELTFRMLSDRDREVGRPIVKMLCRGGWEPFGTVPILSKNAYHEGDWFSLRLGVEDDDSDAGAIQEV